MKNNIITGLDIGSTFVRMAVGELGPEGQFRLIGGAESPSEGINKGIITSIEDAVSSISRCVENLEQITGFPCEHAFAGISAPHIASQSSHGVVAVSKADGEIKETDVERVLEAAQAVAIPPNYEILHVIPRIFSVDSQTGIKDPVGMTGVRLEVDAQIIRGLSSQIKNMTKCVYRTGIEIDELVFSILAVAEAVLNRRQRELGVAVVDIGQTLTSMAVFEEGDVLTTKVLPIGGAHITSDIAIGLRTSIDVAEKVKLNCGTAMPLEVGKREEVDLRKFDEKEEEIVPRKYVAEIIEARCEEIFKMVDRELEEIGRRGKLPVGVVLTGGGAKLAGLKELAKEKFKLPCFIGYPQGSASSPGQGEDTAFSTAIGLVLWGRQLQQFAGNYNFNSKFSGAGKMTGKIKNWCKSLIP